MPETQIALQTYVDKGKVDLDYVRRRLEGKKTWQKGIYAVRIRMHGPQGPYDFHLRSLASRSVRTEMAKWRPQLYQFNQNGRATELPR